MIEATLPTVDEIVRVPAPAPSPQSLAHDGQSLWLGSWETSHVYGIDPKQGRVFADTLAPGKPVGATVVGDELRFVLSENGDGDNRFIRRFVPGHGFKTHDAVACPEDTGSFLAYDGTHLWLTQRHNKRVLQLDAELNPVRTIEIGEQILGATWAGDRLYLALWLGKERGGSHLGFVEPGAAEPKLQLVARFPFVAVGLARDGERFWANDSRGGAIVACAVSG